MVLWEKSAETLLAVASVSAAEILTAQAQIAHIGITHFTMVFGFRKKNISSDIVQTKSLPLNSSKICFKQNSFLKHNKQ